MSADNWDPDFWEKHYGPPLPDDLGPLLVFVDLEASIITNAMTSLRAAYDALVAADAALAPGVPDDVITAYEDARSEYLLAFNALGALVPSP